MPFLCDKKPSTDFYSGYGEEPAHFPWPKNPCAEIYIENSKAHNKRN